MIKFIKKILTALSSNTDSALISHALSCGILLGFMPKNNLLWYLIFVFIFFMRIQRATFTVSVLLGAALAVFMDPLFDTVGCYILSLTSLEPFYIKLLGIPFVAFTKFNNSIVMGSLVCGIVLYVPLFFIARLAVFLWRKFLTPAIRKTKLIKLISTIPLISKISDLAK